jgi:histidinol-phosphate aminotransferase
MAPTFVRSTVLEMEGYTPGEQPPPGARVVKLNTNENPLPPSEKVMAAIRDITSESLRRYPSPMADGFRLAAAKVLGVSPDSIIAGNGSDDILTIATRTFIPSGGSIAYCDPTYSLYPVLAKLQDARGITVPWGGDWSLPVDALAATKADAIYLANPNAPSGTFVPPAKIAELAAKFGGLLLVDEAYADFAEANCLSLVEQFPNLLVTRTMSKAYSLAGLRFGYAVGQPTVIAEMMKVKDSYNCDALSQIAATAAIEDQEYARRTWEHVKSERQRLSEELRELGWDVLPSQANFLLAACPGGDGRTAYLGLKSQGILVRYFDLPGLKDKLRITVGTVQENNAVLAGIQALVAERAA